MRQNDGRDKERPMDRASLKPGSVAGDLDPDLDNIVVMALCKEPERRYSIGSAALR